MSGYLRKRICKKCTKCYYQVKGWFFPSSQHWWGSTWHIVPGSGLPNAREAWMGNGESPLQGHKDPEGTEAPLLWDTVGAWLFSLDKTHWDIINTYKMPEGREQRRGSSQWCLVLGLEALGTNWNTRESFWISGNTFSLQCWLHGKCSWEYPKAVWMWLWVALLEQRNRGLDQMTSRHPFHFKLFHDSIEVGGSTSSEQKVVDRSRSNHTCLQLAKKYEVSLG